MKKNIIISLVIIFLVFSTAGSWYYLIKERQNTKRLQGDIRSGYSNVFKMLDSLRAKNGDLVYRNSVLELTNSEVVNHIDQTINDKLDNLGINPKFVTNYSETVLQHDTHITTLVHDSTIYDTVPAKCFNYTDKYNKIGGCIVGERADIEVSSRDSLTQVVYHGRRINRNTGKLKPAWFFWLPRQLEQVISSDNPSTKILYSKTISVSK